MKFKTINFTTRLSLKPKSKIEFNIDLTSDELKEARKRTFSNPYIKVIKGQVVYGVFSDKKRIYAFRYSPTLEGVEEL